MANVSPREVKRTKTRRVAGTEVFWPGDILRENIFTIIPRGIFLSHNDILCNPALVNGILLPSM